MADVSVRGWTSKGAVKEGSKGKFSTYTLKESQKQRDGSYKSVFYNVTDFASSVPPEDESRVQVAGYLKMREYESAGQKRTSFDITAQKTEILNEATKATGNEPDPFDL